MLAQRIRYDMPDATGETRRQRNARFRQPSPEIEIPPNGEHLWAWFWDLSARRCSGPEPLSFGEVEAWQRVSRIEALPEETDILLAMDDTYLSAVRAEQDANRERLNAKANAMPKKKGR